MLNRIFATTTILFLIATSSAFYPQKAIAQVPQESSETSQPLSKPQAISQAKQTLIKELLKITGSGKNAGQMIDGIVRSELPKLVSAVLKNAPFLDSDRPEIQNQFKEIVSRMAVKYRDRVIKEIDTNQLIEQVSYLVYDKYFTETELRDVISFYTSPTGKKAIAMMPQIFDDSSRLATEILIPKMSRIMTEVIAEELLNALPRKK